MSWPPPPEDRVDVLELRGLSESPRAIGGDDVDPPAAEEPHTAQEDFSTPSDQTRAADAEASRWEIREESTSWPTGPPPGAMLPQKKRAVFGYGITRERVAIVALALLVIGQGAFLLWDRLAEGSGRRTVVPTAGLPDDARAEQPVGTSATASTGQAVSGSAGPSGELSVRTQPPGAAVTVDGASRGTSPLTVKDLGAGDHDVVIESPQGRVRHLVSVAPGERIALVVPLGSLTRSAAAAPARPAPSEGAFSVRSPIELRILEGGRLVGTSAMEQVRLGRGSHRLTLRNDEYAFEQVRTVTVTPGKAAIVNVDLPTQRVAVNAVPWAEVWVGGKLAGETPIGGLRLPLGTHTLAFRHPQFGEKTTRVVVRADQPARVSVDMRK